MTPVGDVTRVGVAGVGRMGAPMAANLARAGFEVSVWNRTVETARGVAEEIGAEVHATPQELAEGSDVVITALSDDRASAQVHLGQDGLLQARRGATHILEMGTLSPRHVRELGSRAGDRTVIDAPVSGSVDAAHDATLLIMVGAEESEISAIRPVLAALGADITCFGRRGAAATTKLAVNMLIHSLNQTLAEALVLTERAGVARELAYATMRRSAAGAPMLGYREPQYLDEVASPVSFALSLAAKDVALALELGDELGVFMPQAAVNLSVLRAADADGFGERDMASLLAYVGGRT